MMNTERLVLKWGTIKSWRFCHDATVAAAQRYADLGWSVSAMAQANTAEHRAALCALIDVLDAETVGNDWTGEEMTKEQAKAYVMGYEK